MFGGPRGGTTIVLVTHDAEVGEACDRIIRARDGTIRSIDAVAAPVSPTEVRPEIVPVG